VPRVTSAPRSAISSHHDASHVCVCCAQVAHQQPAKNVAVLPLRLCGRAQAAAQIPFLRPFNSHIFPELSATSRRRSRLLHAGLSCQPQSVGEAVAPAALRLGRCQHLSGGVITSAFAPSPIATDASHSVPAAAQAAGRIRSSRFLASGRLASQRINNVSALLLRKLPSENGQEPR
jgi:hypothetical protein